MLYVEPQEFLACEDKTEGALGRKLTFTQRPGQRRNQGGKKRPKFGALIEGQLNFPRKVKNRYFAEEQG